jgi:hypothetical protein
MFTGEHLRSLATHLLTIAREIPQKVKDGTLSPEWVGGESSPEDIAESMIKLARQIQILDYDAVLFESLLESYDLQIGSLDKPLEEMGLYVNDTNPVSYEIMKWRIENAV